ncbi:MAG: hypothetical protein MJK14_22440, partial [Rivularia sp. ALOHA_DT_140]|nr:hypothetical protein [Rivularia sp. ALOHA_DT_140]
IRLESWELDPKWVLYLIATSYLCSRNIKNASYNLDTIFNAQIFAKLTSNGRIHKVSTVV